MEQTCAYRCLSGISVSAVQVSDCCLFPSAEEQSQKSLALHNFETVYSHAMKLQVQVSKYR